MDTRGRLGRVDGRYPHWVAPYTGTRYSVIFYQAQGDQLPLGAAVFAGTPMVQDVLTYCKKEDRWVQCTRTAGRTIVLRPLKARGGVGVFESAVGECGGCGWPVP